MDERKNIFNAYIISIVAIVGIIAILVMIAPKLTSVIQQEDLAGGATEFLANRSEEAEHGSASVAEPANIPSGMRLCGNDSSKQMLCSDSKLLSFGYGAGKGFLWNPRSAANAPVNLCYGTGCQTTSCAGGKCREVTPAFFAERAKYQGGALFSGKGSGLTNGMKAASPYYKSLDYTKFTDLEVPGLLNKVPERYYFHYDATNPANPGPGCPQKDPRWNPDEVIVCNSYDSRPGEPWVCSKRLRMADLGIKGVTPGEIYLANYADQNFVSVLIKKLENTVLSTDSTTGEMGDGIHFDMSWIGEEWQVFGANDDPPFRTNNIQLCEAPTRAEKVNNFLTTLQNIRKQLDQDGYSRIIVEANAMPWDSVHHDLLGKFSYPGTSPRSWVDWTELAYVKPGSSLGSASDYIDMVGMDIYLNLPVGFIPFVADRKIGGKEWIESINYFLTQVEKNKFVVVVSQLFDTRDSPEELDRRLWILSSLLMWKGEGSYIFNGNVPDTFKILLPTLSNYKFKQAPGTLNTILPELLIFLGKPIDIAAHYDYFAGTGGARSLWRNRGEKWGSCNPGETDCALAEVDSSSPVGAYGRRFEKVFVVVNPDNSRSAKINLPQNSRYRYKMEFKGTALLQTNGIWNKGEDRNGNPKPCYYKGIPINSITLGPKEAAIILDSGTTVNCP